LTTLNSRSIYFHYLPTRAANARRGRSSVLRIAPRPPVYGRSDMGENHEADYAQKLIQNRRCVLDQRSDWTDHKPARSAENKFIVAHGFAEFGKWHLGEDDEEAEGSQRYKFPYGDFKNVHRCAVLAAEARADTDTPLSSWRFAEAAAIIDQLAFRACARARRARARLSSAEAC
jgi:hypothetical protein